jgi:hypothetical protein
MHSSERSFRKIDWREQGSINGVAVAPIPASHAPALLCQLGRFDLEFRV